MSAKTQPTIKAATGFRKMNPDAVYSAANAIYTGLNGNANIPVPPALSAANSAALDGGRKVAAQRNHQKEVVVKLLDQLASYVQSNCKDEMMRPVLHKRSVSTWLVEAGTRRFLPNTRQERIRLTSHAYHSIRRWRVHCIPRTTL